MYTERKNSDYACLFAGESDKAEKLVGTINIKCVDTYLTPRCVDEGKGRLAGPMYSLAMKNSRQAPEEEGVGCKKRKRREEERFPSSQCFPGPYPLLRDPGGHVDTWVIPTIYTSLQ